VPILTVKGWQFFSEIEIADIARRQQKLWLVGGFKFFFRFSTKCDDPQ
jgi:hypothetical protein